MCVRVFVRVCVCGPGQDPSSEERFHVELHFSPGVKGAEDEEKAPMGFGFRPASSEVSLVCVCLFVRLPLLVDCSTKTQAAAAVFDPVPVE